MTLKLEVRKNIFEGTYMVELVSKNNEVMAYRYQLEESDIFAAKAELIEVAHKHNCEVEQ